MGITRSAGKNQGEVIVAVDESVRKLPGQTGIRKNETRKRPAQSFAPDSHSGCLLCGNKNPLSLGLCFEPAGQGVVQTVVQLNRRLQGYDGILHGGVIGSLLDAAMTHCLFHAGIEAVTGDLHLRFVHPVPIEKKVEIRSWILSSFPPFYSVRAELLFEGHVMAWGEGKFARRRENS
jgi:acyl-coenzyme A thioesterase PaaI-like protein